MKKRMLTIIIVFLSVCGTVEVVRANIISRTSEIVKGFNNPNIVPGGSDMHWIRSIMDEEALLGDKGTERWLEKLTTRIENGEIDPIDTLNEMTEKTIREIGGERSKRRDKIVIRLIYFSAGIDPNISRAMFQGLDSRINASSFSDLRLSEMIDPDDIEIRPAKPYFKLTLGTLDNASDVVGTSRGMKEAAIKSIEDGHAMFTAADYEATALTRMDNLRPDKYEKAVESHANLFDGGFYNPEVSGPAYRVEILSSPYFEFSGRTNDPSRLASQLVLTVLEDVSRGHTAGFTRESVLKLWETVYKGGEKMNLAFRKAVGEMMFRDTLGDLRPEGAERVAGGSFMNSLMEAAKENEVLNRLCLEVSEQVSPSSTVSPSVIFQ